MITVTNPEVVQLKLTSAALYNSQSTSVPAGATVAKPQESSLSQPGKQERNFSFPSTSHAECLLQIPLLTVIYLDFHMSIRLQAHEFN